MNDFVSPVVRYTRKFKIDFSGKNTDSDYKKFNNDHLEKAQELIRTNTTRFQHMERYDLAVQIRKLIKKFLNEVLPPVYLDGKKVDIFGDDVRNPSLYFDYKVDLSFDTPALKSSLFPILMNELTSIGVEFSGNRTYP